MPLPGSRTLPRVAVWIGAAILAVTSVPTTAAAVAPNPTVRLIAPVARLAVARFTGSPIQFDPGALLAAVHGAFDIRITRPDYDHPFGATQLIHRDRGQTVRALPAWAADPTGLPGFFAVKITDSAGATVLTRSFTFCPVGGDQRASSSGPQNPTYPRFCGPSPFTLGTVVGIDDGWAVSALGWNGIQFDGPDGTYTVRVAIAKAYQKLFGVRPRNASVTVTIDVTTSPTCVDICPRGRRGPRGHIGLLGPSDTARPSPDPASTPCRISWLCPPGTSG